MMAVSGNAGPSVSFVQADRLPDYRPAFGVGAARADTDGNLWVRTSLAVTGRPGIVYDAIDRHGLLIDRVQLPPGRDVVGFGPARDVYLLATGGEGGRVELTRR